MSEITLEKIDLIRSRTKLSYSEARELLEKCNGDVVEALIYHEKIKEKDSKSFMEDMSITFEEFIAYMKEVIRKGNVRRIKVKKDEKVLIDIPVNAGIAIGIVALLQPILLVVGTATALITKLEIEITKADGSVEVVSKIIKSAFKDTKEKAYDAAEDIKEKVHDAAADIKEKFTNVDKDKNHNSSEDKENEVNTFTYTVKFDDDDSKES
jgi:hypothetical protein